MTSKEDDVNVQCSSRHVFPESKICHESFSDVSGTKLNYVDYCSEISSDLTSSSEDRSEDLPEISEWRRALTGDRPAIRQLQILTGNVSNSLYRKPNLDELIEKSFFPIVQLDSNGSLVSFTAYDFYPSIPSVPSFFWDDWLNSTYKLIGANARNVLFIHYMVWHPQISNHFLRLLLEISFKEFLYVKHIIIVKPPRANVPEIYKNYFVPVLPVGLEKLELDSIQTLLVCLRTTIIYSLPIRIAFEEELDFILSVIKNNFNKSKKNKFHIVDIVNILYQKEKMTLICEFEGNLVGIMILSLRIDLESLNETFELTPFHGLKKQDPRDEEATETTLSASKPSSLKIQDRPNLLISSEFLFNQMNWELMINKLGVTESHLDSSSSSRSFSSDGDFSEFSFTQFSSLFEDVTSETSPKLSASPMSQEKAALSSEKDQGEKVNRHCSGATHSENFLLTVYVSDSMIVCLNGKDPLLHPSDVARKALVFRLVLTIEAQKGFKFHDLELGAWSKRRLNDLPCRIEHKENGKMAIQASVNELQRIYLPKYHGPSNAFMIDFFAVDINRVDEKLSSFDFLEAAFNLVPDREYCVLIIPTDLLPFPLLDLFMRVSPRPLSTLKQQLYLCHKNFFSLTSVSVRNTKREDLVAVGNFLKRINENNIISRDVLTSCLGENKIFKSFLLTAGETIVGFSMIDYQDYMEHFPLYFDVMDYTVIELHKTENQSIIKNLILNPMYYSQAQFFIREIMRLADVTCLYYTYSERNKDQNNFARILDEFVPVKPKTKVGSESQLPGFLISGGKKYKEPLILLLSTPKLCGMKKIQVNLVVVVVGASRTASSFLENLIFGPTSSYVTYKNLICVTPNGLEVESADSDLKDLMFPKRDKFSGKYIRMLSLDTYVSFIDGVMTEINRSKKYIVINNKTMIDYDYLILTCGLQFQSPKFKTREGSENICKRRLRSSLFKFLLRAGPDKFTSTRHIDKSSHPVNMFVINTKNDAKNAVKCLQSLSHKLKNLNLINKKIIIYGHDLHAFLSIQTFLKLGIPGELMVFVEPFPSENRTFTIFNDYSVDQAVQESIRNCKLTYYTEYFLHDWSISPDDYITSITFHSKFKQVIVPCLLFFPFIQKLVSDVTFNACNIAGLVYDGRLVINHNFRTNDSCIYAAGPFTKYSRRYYASDQDHQYFSSVEVGQKLARVLRYKIDPAVEDETIENSYLVPQMKEPILFYCQLPGDFNFFVLRKPGKEVDLETAYNFCNYGEVLTTGDCQMKKGRGYFRLHLSPEGFVQSITCYTKDKIDYVNLSSLYGLHERLLNNLLLRYALDLIPNFFDYFRQPWALALFHEDFQNLRNLNYQAFTRKFSDEDEDSFSEKVVQELVMSNWQSLPRQLKQKLESQYNHSEIAEEIKRNVLEFLAAYNEDLPGYAHPEAFRGSP